MNDETHYQKVKEGVKKFITQAKLADFSLIRPLLWFALATFDEGRKVGREEAFAELRTLLDAKGE